jgi:hypothetical protein
LKIGAVLADPNAEPYCEFSARQFQPGTRTVAVENNLLTDSRERTTIVNTPRIVPKGMEEAFDAGHHEGKRVTFAERKRSASD